MNNPLAPVQLHLYLQDHFRSLDVLCVQEHKLHGHKFSDFSSQVWRDAFFVGSKASPAYNHTASEPRAGSGGLEIFVAPRIKHMV
jgi:exonuclease III